MKHLNVNLPGRDARYSTICTEGSGLQPLKISMKLIYVLRPRACYEVDPLQDLPLPRFLPLNAGRQGCLDQEALSK